MKVPDRQRGTALETLVKPERETENEGKKIRGRKLGKIL